MNFYSVLFSLVGLSLIASTTFAGDRQRHKNQSARIHQGVKSGQLTPEEARNLRKGQQQVRQMKKDALKDGSVSAEEAKNIHQERNRQSAAIYKEKHDGDVNANPPGGTPAQDATTPPPAE